jgi:hypothetical protein
MSLIAITRNQHRVYVAYFSHFIFYATTFFSQIQGEYYIHDLHLTSKFSFLNLTFMQAFVTPPFLHRKACADPSGPFHAASPLVFFLLREEKAHVINSDGHARAT